MCGIVGIINKDKLNVDKKDIQKMNSMLLHRGPNSKGLYLDNFVGLGHTRLSIIDLSDDGCQPMISSDKNLIVTYNGEIYNYLEIRSELEICGSRFNSNSDTEVILESYKVWGTKCFEKFNGMWAMCIYDKYKNRIILSRDRFGVKPLYIFENDNKIVFASEVKAILSVCKNECSLNKSMIYRFFKGTPEDRDCMTFYNDIHNFDNATCLIIDLNSFNKTTNVFWHVDKEMFFKKWIKKGSITNSMGFWISDVVVSAHIDEF